MELEKKENKTIITKSDDKNENKIENPEIFPIHTNCFVCSSGIVDIIHKLRPQYTLRELSEVLKKNYGVELTKDALSYHFIRYQQDMKMAVSRKMYEKFQQDVDAVSDHQRKTLYLANVSFEHILQRLESGSLVLGIDDFEKLVKLFHSVLRNPEEAGDKNILAIFQRASEQFGCSIEQGVLVKMPRASS